MKTVIRTIYYFLLRFLLSLRYRIKVEGLENIEQETSSNGILFLANHPAEVDPCVLYSILYKKFHPHPVAIDYLFRNKFVRHFLDHLQALPVPHFEQGTNSYKKRQMEKTYERMFQLLRNRENVLIYPAGGLKKQAEEIIGGASGVQTILQNCPDVRIVFIRTIGLWGSSFSRALTGASPNLVKTGMERFKDLLKNGIFFSPRRYLRVVLEEASSDFPKMGSRLEINRYLENWYNQEGPEPLSLVPYIFWKKKIPKAFIANDSDAQVDLSLISEDIRAKVKDEIANLCRRNASDIQSNHFLARDLGLDSLDIAQLILFLKENFNVGNIHASDLVKVEDVFALAAHLKKGELDEEVVEEPKTEKRWSLKSERPPTNPPEGKTLQEAFLRSVHRMGSHSAAADLFSGEVTYKRLKLAVLLIAEKIKQIPQDKIGIMMPASVSVNVLILAALMAKKVPVMINWTLGRRNLQAIVKDVGIETVVSSYGFLDRLENVDLTGLDDKILLIEEMVSSLDWKQKLKTFLRMPRCPKSLMRIYGLKKIHEDDTAVILFTSGTESLPKAVPLSHKNLISNQTSGYNKGEIVNTDVLLGVLPPFHSFGFSVTGLFPLLAGLRVFYFPNPMDGKKIAALIEQWQITILCIVPTFLKNVLRVASMTQMKSLRLVITGAEKTPQDLHDKIAKLNPNTILAEGYGITECGPILTLNPINKPSRGVGEPLEGVEIAIVDLTTMQRLPLGKEGLILASSPGIFKGYLNPELKSPFVELEQKLWYNTGDLGYLDEQGYLILSGRLKRFVKIGGEMVSLVAIEDTLLSAAPNKTWKIDSDVPTFAVLAKEEEGKKGEIHLISTFPLAADEVNDVLKMSGMSNLIRISQVHVLPFIPLLGTGKIDYKALSGRI